MVFLQPSTNKHTKNILHTRALGLYTGMALQQLRCGDIRGGSWRLKLRVTQITTEALP